MLEKYTTIDSVVHPGVSVSICPSGSFRIYPGEEPRLAIRTSVGIAIPYIEPYPTFCVLRQFWLPVNDKEPYTLVLKGARLLIVFSKYCNLI